MKFNKEGIGNFVRKMVAGGALAGTAVGGVPGVEAQQPVKKPIMGLEYHPTGEVKSVSSQLERRSAQDVYDLKNPKIVVGAVNLEKKQAVPPNPYEKAEPGSVPSLEKK
jgi:hypothetical protein